MKTNFSPLEVRDVLLQLYQLRISVSDGGYGDADLATLQKALKWAIKFFEHEKTTLYAEVRASRSVVNNIVLGGRPKLHNFFLCLHDVITALEKWISHHPQVTPVFSGSNADWRLLKIGAKRRIANATRHLTELLDIVRYSNSLAMNNEVLPPELRQSLIAFLEAALAQLRSPMVEKSFLQKLGGWLLALGKEAASGAAKDTFKKLATSAGDDLLNLLDKAI
jgi:hypothetical protein